MREEEVGTGIHVEQWGMHIVAVRGEVARRSDGRGACEIHIAFHEEGVLMNLLCDSIGAFMSSELPGRARTPCSYCSADASKCMYSRRTFLLRSDRNPKSAVLRGPLPHELLALGRRSVLNGDRKSTRLNSSHSGESRMPSSA